MPNVEIFILVAASVVALTLIILIVKAVLWTGRDARRRGFHRVWLIQLLVAIEFPWPWLVYYLVTRNMDRQNRGVQPSARA